MYIFILIPYTLLSVPLYVIVYAPACILLSNTSMCTASLQLLVITVYFWFRYIIISYIDSHPCWSDNGGCSHLCFGVPSDNNDDEYTVTFTASCGCPTGYVLGDDAKTCASGIYVYTCMYS